LAQRALDAAEAEGAYRFIRNERVSHEAILQAHCMGTAQRASRLAVVLAVHDTTTAAFGGGMRVGLGVIDPSECAGFYLHSSFLVDLNGEPIGVASAEMWNREGYVLGKLQQNESQYREDRESLRWMRGVEAVADAIRLARDPGDAAPESDTAPETVIINVMDREGDCLELLANMIKGGHSFVVRGKTDRRLESGRHTPVRKLFASVGSTDVINTSTIKVVCRVNIVRPVLSGKQCKCVSLAGDLECCMESPSTGEGGKKSKRKAKGNGKGVLHGQLPKYVCLPVLASSITTAASFPSYPRCEMFIVRLRGSEGTWEVSVNLAGRFLVGGMRSSQ